MKRFLLFGGWDYYAAGGFHDFLSDHDKREDAEQKAFAHKHGTAKHIEWWHVYDSSTGEIVAADGFAHGAGQDIPDLARQKSC